ncbi:hypothetical protein WA158_007377 [Blastocystis sp. Blastoise]
MSDNLEKNLLEYVNEHGCIENSFEYAASLGVDHQALVGVVKSLEVDFMLVTEIKSQQFWELSEEAKSVLANGSPEAILFSSIPDEGITPDELNEKVGKELVKIGFSHCMKNKWITKDKQSGKILKQKDSIIDELKEQLKAIEESAGSVVDLVPNSVDAKYLIRRQMISLVQRKYMKIMKGDNFSTERKKQYADITKEMIDKDEFDGLTLKPYNYCAMGLDVGGGYLHPLMKVRAEFRKILLEMGFNEMPTSQFVESSFWNFDSLFQPQSHPARDAQDTFFIKDPAETVSVPEDYLQDVKKMHEEGGYDSFGYGYKWQRAEAMKNILRTHTTAVSSRVLYKAAHDPEGFKPIKCFSIDRVFRNETMDATHLAEFHQVELFIADRNLNLGNLIALIADFFKKIGITDLRFKPAYNPYTEPSMEIFGFHPDLHCWTEIGNSGMFRPEMLRPMGLPEDVRVIACGLSLERPTMIKYHCKNIRELFGHKFNLEMSRTTALPRF